MTGSLSMLLHEPHSLVRTTVASVARSMDFALVQDTSIPSTVSQWLRQTPFDVVVLALDETPEALEWIKRLRHGGTASPPQAEVVVTTSHVNEGLIHELRELGVRRVLVKPFKVKVFLETLMALAPKPALDDQLQPSS
jgi:DNA-binding NarL/FixJ family response regulator